MANNVAFIPPPQLTDDPNSNWQVEVWKQLSSSGVIQDSTGSALPSEGTLQFVGPIVNPDAGNGRVQIIEDTVNVLNFLPAAEQAKVIAYQVSSTDHTPYIQGVCNSVVAANPRYPVNVVLPKGMLSMATSLLLNQDHSNIGITGAGQVFLKNWTSSSLTFAPVWYDLVGSICRWIGLTSSPMIHIKGYKPASGYASRPYNFRFLNFSLLGPNDGVSVRPSYGIFVETADKGKIESVTVSDCSLAALGFIPDATAGVYENNYANVTNWRIRDIFINNWLIGAGKGIYIDKAAPCNCSLFDIQQSFILTSNKSGIDIYGADHIQGDLIGHQAYWAPVYDHYNLTPTVTSGTVSSATSTTITDTVKTWTSNQWVNSTYPLYLFITGGTGSGQELQIVANTSTTITVSPAFSVVPDATSTYRIGGDFYKTFPGMNPPYFVELHNGCDRCKIRGQSRTRAIVHSTADEPTYSNNLDNYIELMGDDNGAMQTLYMEPHGVDGRPYSLNAGKMTRHEGAWLNASHYTLDVPFDNGTVSGAFTLRWDYRQIQRIEIGAATTFTFAMGIDAATLSAVGYPTDWVDRFKVDGAGVFTLHISNSTNAPITWPANVSWPSGVPPYTSATEIVIKFYFDGTNYWGTTWGGTDNVNVTTSGVTAIGKPFNIYINRTSSDTATYYAVVNVIFKQDNYDASVLEGYSSNLSISGSGTISTCVGISSNLYGTNAAAVLTKFSHFQTNTPGLASAITTLIHYEVKRPQGTTQTIGTEYGVYIPELHTGAANDPITGYAFYSAGANTPSYHAGAFDFGVTPTVNGVPISDANAIHKNVAAEISTITLKATPALGDIAIIESFADGYAKRAATLQSIVALATSGGTRPFVQLTADNATVAQCNANSIFLCANSQTTFTIPYGVNVGSRISIIPLTATTIQGAANVTYQNPAGITGTTPFTKQMTDTTDMVCALTNYWLIEGQGAHRMEDHTDYGTSASIQKVGQLYWEAFSIKGYTPVAITNVTNNGSGLIRITSTAHGLATGIPVIINGVGGVTAANGGWWSVNVIDANTYDLNGSVFSGTYTSGGTGVHAKQYGPGGSATNSFGDPAYYTLSLTGGSIQVLLAGNYRVQVAGDATFLTNAGGYHYTLQNGVMVPGGNRYLQNSATAQGTQSFTIDRITTCAANDVFTLIGDCELAGTNIYPDRLTFSVTKLS